MKKLIFSLLLPILMIGSMSWFGCSEEQTGGVVNNSALDKIIEPTAVNSISVDATSNPNYVIVTAQITITHAGGGGLEKTLTNDNTYLHMDVRRLSPTHNNGVTEPQGDGGFYMNHTNTLIAGVVGGSVVDNNNPSKTISLWYMLPKAGGGFPAIDDLNTSDGSNSYGYSGYMAHTGLSSYPGFVNGSYELTFVSWHSIDTQDYLSEIETYQFNVGVPQQYTVTVAAGFGGTTSPAPGIYNVNEGTSYGVTAIPNSGYNFSGWTGTVLPELQYQNPISLPIDGNKTITANFVSQLSVSISGPSVANKGTVTYTAQVSGLSGTITYQWYKSYYTNGAWGSWIGLASTTNTVTTTMYNYPLRVKVIVTRGGQTAETIKYTYYAGGGI